MFTRFLTATLAFCAVTSFEGVAQSLIPDRHLLPEVQYHNALPVESPAGRHASAAKLQARSRFVHDGTGFAQTDSISYRYASGGDQPDEPQAGYAEMYQRRFGVSAGNSERRSFQTFNADKTLASFVLERRDSLTGTWTAQCRQAFIYRDGRLATDTAWNWDEPTAQWKPAACTEYFRNGAGYTIRIVTRHWSIKTGSLDSVADIRYVVDEAGNAVECVSRYGTGKLRISARMSVSYSSAGAPLAMYHQQWDSVSGGWRSDYGFRFVYGNHGARIMQTNLSWDETSRSWKDDARYTYQYGTGGLLAVMNYQRFALGTWTTFDRYEYSYNASGQRIGALHKLAGYSAEPVVMQSSEKINFYYETLAAGKVASQSQAGLRIWPVPAGSELSMDVRAFAGKPYRCTVTDIRGRKLMSMSRPASEQGSDRIALDGLPAGTYILMLQSTDGRSFTARFNRL